MAIWKVLDEKGISYTHRDGGEVLKFPKDSFIREIDVKNGFITLGGLNSLEEAGRVEMLNDDQSPIGNKPKIEDEQGGNGNV